jgi:hypothetical protein
MRIVEEEADESMYFLELTNELNSDKKEQVKFLHAEANEIIAMTVSSNNTTLKGIEQSKTEIKGEVPKINSCKAPRDM